jgi:anti-sigma factor RsiW
MNPSRHLTPDEIVERVFPVDDRTSAVPEHLGTCAACQERVATLRDAWLLDRGAVSGAVDDLPPGFWEAQAAATMASVRAAAPGDVPSDVKVFPSRMRGILRHPALAVSSLAAALLLVGGISLVRSGSTAPPVHTASVKANDVRERTPVAANDASDDELLVSVDRALEDSSLADLVVEETL